MKIYEFNWNPEKDWVFAPNIKKAIEFYLSFTQCGDLDGCEVKSVPKSEWDTMCILDINESEPDEDYDEDDYACGYKIEMTFKEYAEKNTQTDMIATTEF